MNNIIIFPTDTVYGIGAKINDVTAMKEIFTIKKRETNKRLAVLCFDINQIKEIAYVDDIASKLINEYMPGGLSLILKTKEKYINEMISDTIAVRIPNHELALHLLKINGPMATTSVNTSGEDPMNTYDEILNVYRNSVDEIYENEEEIQGVSSTIINLTNNEITLIREGNISFNEIKEFLNV